MKKKFRLRRGFALLCLITLALCLLSGCGGKKEDTGITSIEQLGEPGRKIGVGIGTGEDISVRAEFPKAEIELFNEVAARKHRTHISDT